MGVGGGRRGSTLERGGREGGRERESGCDRKREILRSRKESYGQL